MCPRTSESSTESDCIFFSLSASGCECNYWEPEGGYHLDYETLMNHRAELGCRRLVLTHMNDEMLRRIKGLDTEGAEDGKSYVL